MVKASIYFFFSMFLFFSCSSVPDKTVDEIKVDSFGANEYKKKTGLETEPVIGKTDSLQLVYYDNPDGDSLRYSRFFTSLAVSNGCSKS